ncbi:MULTISPECIES: FAD-binding domain-containing protein [unclassified Cellulophaga]|uniref:FAD-binding domain-containing protein n=1 Tax=unclassified Cellulophaga TaxID=2634405 RepID=UPI0026E43A94|nr:MULTISPECIES: FAD-binding domain-containing protein [unclassified Cellulophaga]MDO6491899.1 FAD-binding domain-containing protein [Cellulophaga sp. 2_MG-2023]MDO6495446.1 FAD-binding domain-containing protein [Cellulophaga sp. 3_MG-2023]
MSSLINNTPDVFPTGIKEIYQRVNQVNPVKYASTRNYINGAVTHLSPYISRGVISTKFVLKEVLAKGYTPAQIEKFIQELAWRDYWQQVWIAKGEEINSDLKHKQTHVSNTQMPKSIADANTGVTAVDDAIRKLRKTGYIHNHLRMYVASLVCNIGQSHWLLPAKWMYYNLLDADWASNALSWQWVAGANANKKYYANQENINKYCFTEQNNTFLDVPYSAFESLKIPEELEENIDVDLTTTLPKPLQIKLNEELPTCVYNFYNLDPNWRKEEIVNRVLLLEPSHFKKYPVSKKSIDFMLKLVKDNISNVQVYVGEFSDLVAEHQLKKIYFKEHPTVIHYQGEQDARDWMFTVNGYYPSFFSFWKKCKKELSF